MEHLRMSKASSSPWPAGAGVINKAMSCVENPVQTGVWGSELCDLVMLPAAEPDFRASKAQLLEYRCTEHQGFAR